MARIGKMVDGLKPTMMMVLAQIGLTGLNIFLKLASANGMKLRIFVAYRFMIAAMVMVPLSLVLERKRRPKLTWVIVMQTFFCGLFSGSLAQNLFAECLSLTSATFAVAMVNLVPGLTFILALFFGMERLRLNKAEGKGKIMGTLTCIGGAMLLTFYKGPEVDLWSTNLNLVKMFSSPVSNNGSGPSGNHHVLGALLALSCCVSCAVGFIVQAKLMKNYPCPYSSTALIMIFGALQSFVYALATERDWTQWKLGWNLRLFGVLYSGIVASALTFTIWGWCVKARGPLFVSVFSPLLLVLVAISGSLFLDEKLHMGSILGAVVIVLGLYLVLWGKGEEMKRLSKLALLKGSKSSNNLEQVQVDGIDRNLSMSTRIDDENNNMDMNNRVVLGIGVDLCSPALVELSNEDDNWLANELPVKKTACVPYDKE